MMHMSSTLIVLMVLLVLLVVGGLLAVRYFGGREFEKDHHAPQGPQPK